MNSRTRMTLGRFLITVLLLNSLAGFSPALLSVRAQDKNRVIVINAEQPNVWTLEQAHYLLAQMHRRNLDLKAKTLEELDPNEINGLRFDVMRMLIEFGATFNQADLASNRLLTRDQNFNAGRRQELIVERDRLRRESLTLTGEIEELQTAKADTNDEAEKKRLDAKIDAKTTRRAKVDKEVELINDELGTLSAPSGQLRATEGGAQFDPNRLPASIFDDAFRAAAAKQIDRFSDAPKLNASLRLDNFLQMQYEIIAKQLTLLRDEVGPGERLLFLELPQTVNVAHHESNDKWAQSWWKIAGYTRRTAQWASPIAMPTQTPKARDNQPSITTEDEMNSILSGKPIIKEAETEPDQQMMKTQKKGSFVEYKSEFINLDGEKGTVSSAALGSYMKGNMKLENRMVRTIDLIPRQSSLNVNDMNLRVKSGAFNFVLSTLFGFGSRLNIQRQREQFSQFVQQELYSSAFGKGAREFGWTFTPMPGTNRLQSGVRTTYAVVVVPEEATSIVLESNGCYFPRSAYQPNDFADTKHAKRWGDSRTSRGCGVESKVFVVPVPNGGADGSNDFWVRGIAYQPVPKGKRAVVLISGSNFSSQIGVLVNGVPLAHSIGLAQPLILDDSRAGTTALRDLSGEKVRGRIERIDSNKIIFSFEIDDFVGIPAITLVAPGKAIDINWLDNVTINGAPRATLSEAPFNACGNIPTPNCLPLCTGKPDANCLAIADWIFGKRPQTQNFRIDTVEMFSVGKGLMRGLIHGAGFKPESTSAGAQPTPMKRLYVNGSSRRFTPVSPELIEVEEFPVPAEAKIQVTLVYGDDTVQSQPIRNPAHIQIDRVTVVSYEPATEKKAGVLVVRIEGTGFTSKLLGSPAKVRLDVTSSTEAFVTIPNPNETEVITLLNPETNVMVSTVVARKPPK
jgi:hypothetical protein